jgi:hypothetical protein
MTSTHLRELKTFLEISSVVEIHLQISLLMMTSLNLASPEWVAKRSLTMTEEEINVNNIELMIHSLASAALEVASVEALVASADSVVDSVDLTSMMISSARVWAVWAAWVEWAVWVVDSHHSNLHSPVVVQELQ